LKIEQTEATLYGGKVRNPKELQDLQNESAALKRYLNTLEERQLEALIVFEENEAKHQAAAERLMKVEEEVRQTNHHLIAEQASLAREIERLETERDAVALPIPREEVVLYENLRAQKRGVAVARINNNTCAACGSSLNAALLQAARSPNQITRCDTCGRILFAG
jgi:predicted  nucleic acid-binding Zn-ribbon protein